MTAPDTVDDPNYTLDRRAPSRHDTRNNPFFPHADALISHHGPPPTHRPSRHPAPRDPAWQPARADLFREWRYELYLDPLADAAGRSGVEIWCYCPMPNHVHIIAVPRDEDG
jgi:hypothetical protein